MLLDIRRQQPPNLCSVAAFARSLSALVSILNDHATMNAGDAEQRQRTLLAFDIVDGCTKELAAALDILDYYESPTAYGFPADPSNT